MIIELERNEVMWILDQCAKEVVRGNIVISAVEGRDDLKEEIEAAREIVSSLASLGLKLTGALEADVKSTMQGKAEGNPTKPNYN